MNGLYAIDFSKDLADEVLAEIRARRDFDISAWAWDLAKQTAELND